MMSSDGPVIEADDLRKKVSGTVLGSPPPSLTWEAKLVICATTRHGFVTGDTNLRLSTGTVSLPWTAASMAARSASNSAVVVALVAILAAPSGFWTHQESTVRRMEIVMIWLLSSGRSGCGNRIHCRLAAR